MKFFIALFTLYILTLNIIQAQSVWGNLKPLDIKNKRNAYLDTLANDTVYYERKNGRGIFFSPTGIELMSGPIYGGMGTVCGCEVKPHGYWIKRYKSGKLKETGQYHCKRKIGAWHYYFENGNISKIETFAFPYQSLMLNGSFYFDTLFNLIHMSGPYVEYYENGQVKVEGRFEIFEKLTIDTIFTFDIETYETKFEIAESMRWKPHSVKVGSWQFFDPNGLLLRKEEMDSVLAKDDYRPIFEGIIELFGQKD